MSNLISKYKADLLARTTLNELTEEEKSRNTKIAKGVGDVPVAKMIDQVNYISNNLLPAIEKKSGKKNADYDFFKAVAESLMFAVVMADRYDAMETRFVRLKVFQQLTAENLAFAEAELQKYTTLEDLFLSDALNRYADGVKSRVNGLLKGKKSG